MGRRNVISVLFPFLKASGRPYRPPENGREVPVIFGDCLTGGGPRSWKKIAGHQYAGGEVGRVRKLKGARARIVARVVSGVAQRETAPAGTRRIVAGRAVDDHGVEHQAVARRHRPRADVVFAAL